MEYTLQITDYGMFTCDAVSSPDFGDGFSYHRCPYFETPQEVAEWVRDNV